MKLKVELKTKEGTYHTKIDLKEEYLDTQLATLVRKIKRTIKYLE